jgi:hypothetical protein
VNIDVRALIVIAYNATTLQKIDLSQNEWEGMENISNIPLDHTLSEAN